MADICKTITHIKKFEGGWANHPADYGRCTMSGITIGCYQLHYGKDKTCDDLKNITPDEWLEIFMTDFWKPCKAGYIHNDSIATLVVDMAFNSGVKNAIKRIQKCLGCSADGIIGPLTLRALNDENQQVVFNKIFEMREKYYHSLASKNGQSVFLNGWLRRLHSIKFIPQ